MTGGLGGWVPGGRGNPAYGRSSKTPGWVDRPNSMTIKAEPIDTHRRKLGQKVDPSFQPYIFPLP